MRELTEKSLFFLFSQTADLLTVMQPSARAPFSGLCFRLLPKCLLAPTVCILKSVFHSASCSFLAQDSVKWTSAINFGLSNRMCVCLCVCPCELLGCWLTFNVPSPHVRGREIDDGFTLTHLVSSVSSRMTHGDSSTPTHFSKLWATCCVSGMACTHRWAWQTCGWPSSAWSWVLPATPCLWATPRRWFSLWTHLDGSTRRRWVMTSRYYSTVLKLSNLITFTVGPQSSWNSESCPQAH